MPLLISSITIAAIMFVNIEKGAGYSFVSN